MDTTTPAPDRATVRIATYLYVSGAKGGKLAAASSARLIVEQFTGSARTDLTEFIYLNAGVSLKAAPGTAEVVRAILRDEGRL